MDVETGRYAVDRLVAAATQHGYDTLRLKYAGGEPTLNFDTVEAIHDHAVRRAAQAGLGLTEVVLSNGVGVPDATLDVMAEAGLGLMISLDGGPAAHNRLRSGPDGCPTYAAVVDTVERAMARALRPDVSITLTARNLDGVSGAARFALARNLPFSLNFYRECAAAAAAARYVVPGRRIDAVRGVFQVASAYPDYAVPLAGILDRARLDVPHYYPCSAGRDYVAVDIRGGVAACQMLLDTPWSHLSAEDPLAAIRCQGRGLFQPVDAHPECQDCPWRAACAGGCPLMWGTALHEAYCRAYRALLPELVQLEARRLVTRHGIRAVL
jgi:uncharacterized protein